MPITLLSSVIGHMPDVGWTANGGQTGALFAFGVNLLVAGATYDAGGGAVNVSDSYFNTWIPLSEQTSIAGSGNVKARLWYVANPVILAPSVNFTFSGSSSYIQGMVAGFGITSSVPFEAQNGGGTSSGNVIQPGTITPLENNELLVAIAGYNNQVNLAFDSVDSGFSFIFNSSGVSTNRFPGTMAYKVQGTGTPDNPSFTYSTLSAGVAAMAAFRAVPSFILGCQIDAKMV